MSEEIEALKKRIPILFRCDLIDLLEKASIAFASGKPVYHWVEGETSWEVEPEDLPVLFEWLREMNEANWN